MANTYNTKLTNTVLPNSYSITGGNGYTINASASASVGGINTTLITIPLGEDKVVLNESATLEVKGNVVINGLDLEERLKTIEKVLMIPERDAKIEAKYPSLKKKYDEYIKQLEKYRMWDSIKGE
jgi:hypothetical protein